MLRVIRAPAAKPLWQACVDRFLERNASAGERRAWLWLLHRGLRDQLYEEAHARGIEGWFDPPVNFLGDLRGRFDIRDRQIGLLTRRRLLSRHAARLGKEILGREPGLTGGVIRGHMLDGLLGDLLPEGVTPEELESKLGRLGGDDFALKRNRWIVAVYRAYLDSLRKLKVLDNRSINSRIAERIEDGGLPRAIGGAGELHIYGITNARHRRRLLRALASQGEVEVTLYLPHEPEPDPFIDNLAARTDIVGAPTDGGRGGLGGGGAAAGDEQLRLGRKGAPADGGQDSSGVDGVSASAPRVQPAPDAAREMAWVARRVKKLLADGAAEPHEIAVIARSGQDNTLRAFRALKRAGVPATARIRTPLNEIPALKALLLILRGAGRNWDYRTLRAVLEHPCFDTRMDLRSIDAIASLRRVEGLDDWAERLAQLHELVQKDREGGDDRRAREVRGKGLFPDRIEKDIAAFETVREALEPLGAPRPEAEWIDVTMKLLSQDRGIFRLRRRICDPVEDAVASGAGHGAARAWESGGTEKRWEIVRTDQRGILALETLLGEWLDLEHPADPLEPGDWHALLVKLMQANELALSTPGQKGVQILEAHDAALVPFSHTFVVHANDREFPRSAGVGGVLTDAERRRLAEDFRLPTAFRDELLRHERTLWRAVTQQTGAVWISYRTADAKGTPLLRSLMVPDDTEDELPRVRRPTVAGEPLTEAEADERAAEQLHRNIGRETSPAAKDGRRTVDTPRTEERPAPESIPSRITIAPARPARIQRAIMAAAAEAHRGPGLARYPAFTLPLHPPLGPPAESPRHHPALMPNPWNGRIRDPDVLRVLEERFGDDYTWSASQLELYARVPFTFLIERVLRLEGVEEAKEETTPLTRGGVTHEILERFYNEFMDKLPGSLSGDAKRRLEEISHEVCDRREEEGEWLGLAPLWKQARQQIIEAVGEYVEWELEYMAKTGTRPIMNEAEFGFGDDVAFLKGDDVFGRPAQLRIRGKVDRLDEVGPARHEVVDYKSGKTQPFTNFADATALQGALYAEVMENRGYPVVRFRYRSIAKPGKPVRGSDHSKKVDYGHAMSMALAIPLRVRSGFFEAVASWKGGWESWDPGREIRRAEARLNKTNRFETFGDTPEDGGDSLAEVSNV